jgi:hypothetical protein
VVASNGTSARDQNGENDDWIELYNTTANPIDLSGMYLTDDALDLMLWSFPVPTTIPANGYLTVWADNDVFQSGLHASFKLNASGELVILSNGATFHDQVGFGVQTTDVAYARCPDGGATFAYVVPTYMASNNCNASIDQMNFDVKIYPNPFANRINLSINSTVREQGTITIYDISGRKQFSASPLLTPGNNEIVLEDLLLPKGVYILELETPSYNRQEKLIRE